MASVTPRKNKEGDIISYQIKVTRGRDKLTGKQLTPYTMTYTPPEGWSKKAIERNLQKVMGEFEAACKRGEVLTKEEQKQQAIQEQEAREREAWEEERQPGFTKYCDQFIEEKSRTNAYKSINVYKKTLKRAIAFFGDTKVNAIDTFMCRKYVNELQTTARNEKTGEPLSLNTIKRSYNVLHTLFEQAIEDGIIENNPMDKVKRPVASKEDTKKEPIVYDEKQTRYIIECLNKEPLMWKALMLFLIDSGCRRGEAAGLMWKEIDFNTGKVNICRNAQYTEEQGLYITTPKSDKARSIILNKPVLDILKEWKRQQARLFFGLGIANEGYCFTQKNGHFLNPENLTGYVWRFGKKYDLPGIHPHALRHTMATIMIANRADVVSVSKKLGHSSPAITLNVYSHANEEAQRRANEALADSIYSDKQRKKA